MYKDYNDVPNMHAVVVRYHGPTNCKGARVSLYSPRFEQRIYCSRDYGTNNIVAQGFNELVARGFNVIGVAETDKHSYTLLTDTFKGLKD